MPFAIKHNKRIKIQGSLETLRLFQREGLERICSSNRTDEGFPPNL